MKIKRDKPLILCHRESDVPSAFSQSLARSSLHVQLADARDADAAQRLTLTDLPDLLVVDATRTDEPALRILKRLPPRSRRCPVLVVLTVATEPARAALLAAGADDVLVAPLEEDLLVSKVLTLLKSEYVSSLPFFALPQEASAFTIGSKAKIISASETELTFTCPFCFTKGGELELQIDGARVGVAVRSTSAVPSGGFLVKASIERVIGCEWSDLRRALKRMDERSRRDHENRKPAA